MLSVRGRLFTVFLRLSAINRSECRCRGLNDKNIYGCFVMLGVSWLSDLSFTCQSADPPRYRNPAWMGWPCLVWLSTISQRALNIFAIKTNGANSANIMHMNLRTVTPRWSSTPLQCHKMFSNSKGLYASPSLFSRVLRAAERVRRYNFKQLAKYPRVLGAI